MASFKSAPSPDRLRASLRALVGGMDIGAELAGWTLVHVEVDEAAAYIFERPGGRMEIALGPRDPSLPHFAQSASFNLSYFVARLPGRPLTDDGARLAGAVAQLVARHDNGRARERLRAPAVVDRGRGPAGGAGEIRTTRVDTLLAPVTLDGAAYYTANPYVGCLIGCGFCYAQPRVAMVRRLLGMEERAWGRYVVAKENAPEVLDRELSEKPSRPVVLSPLVADVYQSVERRLALTRRCLEVLARHRVRTYVLTRATLVLRDVDVFQRIPDATVGFSISTDSDEIGRAFEPRAAPISARLQALATLRRAGIRTVAVVQPILPMDPIRLADRLAEVCEAVRVDVYLPADLGGTPLQARAGSAAQAPSKEEEARLARALVTRLGERGVRLWTTHVPP